MKSTVLIISLACVASAGFVGWRVHSMRSLTVNQFEVLTDPSLSYAGGCESAVGAAEELLQKSSISSKSTLTVLVLGDDSTAREPWLLAKYAVPTSRKVIEGRFASVRRQQTILKDLWSKCVSLQRTSISPIFLGVKQTIADLRGHGCREGTNCELVVASDLEENVDRAIKSRISHAYGRKTSLPRGLDNSGIKVTFCGFAATAGRILDPSGREVRTAPARDANREDRLQDVWRSMFTRPELIRFEPYCPQPSILPGQGAKGLGALSEGKL